MSLFEGSQPQKYSHVEQNNALLQGTGLYTVGEEQASLTSTVVQCVPCSVSAVRPEGDSKHFKFTLGKNYQLLKATALKNWFLARGGGTRL